MTTCLQKIPTDVGYAVEVKHTIDTGNHSPIWARPIYYSQFTDDKVNSEVHKLLD